MVIALKNWKSLVVLYQHMWILFQSWINLIVSHSIVWFFTNSFWSKCFFVSPACADSLALDVKKRWGCASVTAECVKYVCYSQETQFMVGQFRAGLLCFRPVSLFYSVGNKKMKGHRQEKLYNKGQIKKCKKSEILIIHITLRRRS